jgi:CRP/FNR family cyclic AMP-dependent transcriptional regulator
MEITLDGGHMQEQIDYNRLHFLTIFGDLNKNELEIVYKYLFVKKAPKYFFLFSQGMPGDFLYIIMSGRVEIIKKTKDNKKILLATMGANDIVGEMSLIDSEPRSATGRTIEDSVLVGLTKKAFNEMLNSYPLIAAKVLMGLLKVINRRLRITTDKKIEDIKL